jgi:aconitase A
MNHMNVVVQQLKKEREHTQKQLQRIDEALAALGSSSNGASPTMSAAARRKISLAQKARWAKHKAKPTRTISAAGRRRIAAAQRARWAKLKRAA